MNFLIDPHILAVPAPDNNGSRVRDYLDVLRSWSDQARFNHVFWLSTAAVVALQQEDQYPTLSSIRTTLERAGDACQHLDAIWVCKACRSIFSPRLVDPELQDASALQVDLSSTVVIPKVIAERLKPSVAVALRGTLARLAYAKEQNSPIASNLLFASKDLDNHANTISVQIGAPTHFLESKWSLIANPSAVVYYETPDEIWKVDPERAVVWGYYTLTRDGTLDPAKHLLPKPIRIRSQLVESIADLQLKPDQIGKVFTTAALVLTRQLRRGRRRPRRLPVSQQDPTQRRRHYDGARAWRAIIAEKHPGYALHYWERQDGTIELSIVTRGKSYSIH